MEKSFADEFTLLIKKEIAINAPVGAVWESVLDQVGPGFKGMEGKSMNLRVELFPGGKWVRDLGNNTGHFWGHVQVIKPPTLLELCGPMFMSSAAINHLQYRLTEKGSSTMLTLTHRAFGEIAREHREGVQKGWEQILNAIKTRSEK